MIKLELTDKEMQVIGTALGNMPYNTAAPVIASLQKQINSQAKTGTEEQKEQP